MEELIAKRYANALSQSTKDIDSIAEILNVLTEAIDTKEVKNVLTSPIVPNEKKTDMVLSALGNDVDNVLVNFIKVLGENRRLDIIPSISKVLNRELQKVSNRYEGIVKSKKTLDAKAVGDLEKRLKKYTGSTIKLKQEKSDLDDLRVLVDDLGIEVNFSKQRVKEQLIDFIKKSL
jgi:F-type H+-transporting ATPase subunit delta